MGRFYLVLLILAISFNGFTLCAEPDHSKEISGIIADAEEIVINEPEKAIGMLQEALNSFDYKHNKTEFAKIYSLLGDAYYYLDNIDLSLENYHKSAEINTLTGNDESDLQIVVLGYLGFLYDLKEQHLIALDYYTQALQIARKVGNKAEIATNLANIGKIQTLQGYYKEAL